MRKTAYVPRFLFLTACLLFSFAETRAQDSPATSVPFAYSAYFGTGWYQIGDGRDVYVFRYAPRWEMQEADFAEDGSRTIGIEFRFPLTFGLENFSSNDLPGSVDPDNLKSMSVTPGVDIIIPISQRWLLRPFAAAGWGQALDNSDSVIIYWAGVKSRYSFQHGKLDWALLNSITYVGHTPSIGFDDDFWPIMAGLEFDYPLGNRKLGGEQLFLSWHGMYTTFQKSLDQPIGDGLSLEITDEWEFGFSIHKEEEPIKIWFMKFHRLGLAYRVSSSGELEGISFVLRGIFDR